MPTETSGTTEGAFYRLSVGFSTVRQQTPFANSSPQPFINGIKAARQQIVARSDEDREDFLRKRGFSKPETAKIIDKVLMEEGHPPSSIFDFVQGITRLAREKPHQDARLEFEGKAKKLLDRVG